MGIREEFQKRPWIGFALAGALMLGAGGWMWQTIHPASVERSMPQRVYFSDDDGKSFFADDIALIPPFEHNGHLASMAMVFRCADQAPFVGYLLRYDNRGKAALDALPADQRRAAAGNVLAIKQSSAEVKRPGDSRWLAVGGSVPTGQVLIPKCPDGDSGTPQPVLP